MKKENPDIGWAQTHYIIVQHLTNSLNTPGFAQDTFAKKGNKGLMELSYNLTCEFEELCDNREWDEDYFEQIKSFLKDRD